MYLASEQRVVNEESDAEVAHVAEVALDVELRASRELCMRSPTPPSIRGRTRGRTRGRARSLKSHSMSLSQPEVALDTASLEMCSTCYKESNVHKRG